MADNKVLPQPSDVILLTPGPDQAVAPYANHFSINVRPPEDVTIDFYQLQGFTARHEGERQIVEAKCVSRVILSMNQGIALMGLLAEAFTKTGVLSTNAEESEPEAEKT